MYSIMYYQLNESCISDFRYEAIVRQLLKLQAKMSLKELEKTTYYYAMSDFEGSTGCDLYSKLTKKDQEYLTEIAEKVYALWKKEKR